MNFQLEELILAWVGIACWGACFWWMHRLSARQEAMLQELHDVTRRIESLSEKQHSLIKEEVHPAVEKIQESVEDVAVAVTTEGSRQNP